MTDLDRADIRSQLHYDARKKSLVVAYLLLIFFGGFGAHRFYLGRVGSGVVQLALFVLGWALTVIGVGFVLLTLLGLWVLADLFLVPGIARDYNLRLADTLTR
jgi:TM2 domain-containing membrane protein YozV